MSKQPCGLIQDILPLYVENSVSDTTRDIVDDHLRECPTCQKLYDELTMQGPVLPDLPDLKESLPEADTFKTWWRRLKTVSIIGMIFIVLAGAGIALLSYKAGSSAEKDILSVNDVTRTLKQADLVLTPDAEINPADYKMGEIEPKIYQVKNLDGVLFIYHFASIGERDTVYRQWYDQWEETNRKNNDSSGTNMFSPQWPYHLAYAAKNTIIVIGLNQFSSEADYEQKIPLLLSSGKAIFYKLNGGQQIVFEGETENWKGKVIVNYYNHFWKDDQGVMRYDGWSNKQEVLEFKGGDPGTIQGEFSYEFKTPLSKSGGTMSDGFNPMSLTDRDTATSYGGSSLDFGLKSSGGVIPQKDSVFTVTVNWNNLQESFELKASE